MCPINKQLGFDYATFINEEVLGLVRKLSVFKETVVFIKT